jgi:hypothetical protein
MEQYTNSISLLLQHGQRFFEIWNFQIIIAVAAVGFIGNTPVAQEPRGVYVHATNEGGKIPPNAFGLYDLHGNIWDRVSSGL